MMKRDRILLVISALQLGLFAPLAWWASKHPQPPKEIAITRLMQKRQNTLKRRIAQIFSTSTGSAASLNLLVVPVAVLLWRMKLRLEAIMTVATLWTNALTRTGIKRLINRPRPKPLLVHIRRQSKGRSFPSGHVASSIILWGWLFTIARSHREMNRVWRGILLSIALLFMALIGPSRIYLGDHWTTDVLGGYLYGGGWFGLSLCLYHELRKQARW